jgi:hypothetical protein
MKITRANYEAWVIDYIEGRLSEAEQAELHVFIAARPDLEVDFDLPLAGDLAIAASPEVDFSHLRVAPEFDDRALWLAAVAEGDLTGRMANAAREDSKTRAEIAVYSRMRLTPDVAVVYPNKGELKRTPVIALRAVIRYAAAAAVLIAVFASAYFFTANDPVVARLAEVDSVQLSAAGQRAPIAEAANDEKEAFPTVKIAPDDVRRNDQAVKGQNRREAIAVSKLDIRPVGRIDRAVHQLALAPTQITFSEEAVPLYAAQEEIVPLQAMPSTQTLTVTEFLASRAQERLIGRKPSDEESFLRALAGRTFARVEQLSDGQVAVALPAEDQSQRFRFKLGRVSVER